MLYRSPHARYELGVRATAPAREVFVRQTVGADVSTVTAVRAGARHGPLILQIDAEPTRYTFSWGPVPSAGPRRQRHHHGAARRGRDAPPGDGGDGRLHRHRASVSTLHTPMAIANPAPAAFDWFDYEPKP